MQNELIYKPVAVPLNELSEVVLELDEFEALRLCDLEGFEQTEAGARMGVSRGTIQRLLISGRSKLVEALVQQRAIRIKAGQNQTEEE